MLTCAKKARWWLICTIRQSKEAKDRDKKVIMRSALRTLSMPQWSREAISTLKLEEGMSIRRTIFSSRAAIEASTYRTSL